MHETVYQSIRCERGGYPSSNTKYSDIELLTWDQNKIDILAVVEVDASSKSKAEEKLAKIDVKMVKSGNTVSLETNFQEGWSKNVKVDINITVKAPAYMNLDMNSSYGDVFIQELTGHVLMNVRYGNLKAGSLLRGNEKPFNKVTLAYSDGVIDKAGWMELGLAYSDLEMGTSTMLFVDSKYSKLLGEKTGGIVTEGAYDKYEFDEIDNMVAELRYSGVKFAALNKKLDINSKYTNIKILHVSKDFKEVNAVSSYGNIYLDVEDGASFKLEAETKYGHINMDQEGKLSKQKENNSEKIWGTVGSAPKGSMNLEARYGNIDIK